MCTPITIEVRNSLSQPEIVLDLTGFKKEIKDDLHGFMDKMLERMEKPGELKSLTEKKFAPVEFDYREGVSKVLKSKRDNVFINEGSYKFREAKKDIKDLVTTKYNDKTKNTEYTLNESLVEAIGSLNPDCCIPEIWADKIERDHVYPGSVFLGAWFVNWYTDIENRPGDKVHICRVGPATCADLSCDEPTTTAATITCPYITLEHDTCAYYICREDIEDVQVGLVDAINEGLGSCLAVCVDNYFFNVALSCTNAGTVTSTGAMTGSLILEAMGSMLAGNQSEVTLTGPILYPSKADHAPCPVDEPDAGHQLQIRQPVWGTRRDRRRKTGDSLRHRAKRHPQGNPAHRRRHLPEPPPSQGRPSRGDEARHNHRERVQSALPEEVGHSRHQVRGRLPTSRTRVQNEPLVDKWDNVDTHRRSLRTSIGSTKRP